MIKVNQSIYDAAQVEVSAGRWVVDPDRGIVTWTGVVAGSPNTCGYLRLRFTSDGVRMSALAHRVMWEAVNGRIPQGMYVNHRDGNKANNAIGNLELVSHSENMRHARTTGLMVPLRGSQAPASKLSAVDVADIRTRATSGELHRLIAEDYGVARSTVTRLACGRHYTV